MKEVRKEEKEREEKEEKEKEEKEKKETEKIEKEGKEKEEQEKKEKEKDEKEEKETKYPQEKEDKETEKGLDKEKEKEDKSDDEIKDYEKEIVDDKITSDSTSFDEEEEEEEIIIYPNGTYSSLDFSEAIDSQRKAIKQLKTTIHDGLFNNTNLTDILSNQNRGVKFFESFDCGFLKNDLAMIYTTLYDLSVESRILCIISCCIGFFGAIAVYFFLLVMYHYNNEEFTEGSKDIFPTRHRFNRMRKFDVSSRNDFLDKYRAGKPRKYFNNNNKIDLSISSE